MLGNDLRVVGGTLRSAAGGYTHLLERGEVPHGTAEKAQDRRSAAAAMYTTNKGRAGGTHHTQRRAAGGHIKYCKGP